MILPLGMCREAIRLACRFRQRETHLFEALQAVTTLLPKNVLPFSKVGSYIMTVAPFPLIAGTLQKCNRKSGFFD